MDRRIGRQMDKWKDAWMYGQMDRFCSDFCICQIFVFVFCLSNTLLDSSSDIHFCLAKRSAHECHQAVVLCNSSCSWHVIKSINLIR